MGRSPKVKGGLGGQGSTKGNGGWGNIDGRGDQTGSAGHGYKWMAARDWIQSSSNETKKDVKNMYSPLAIKTNKPCSSQG